MADILAIVEDPSGGSSTTIVAGTAVPPNSIENMVDVDLNRLLDGSVLVYKSTTNKWTSTTTLDAQNMDAGEF